VFLLGINLTFLEGHLSEMEGKWSKSNQMKTPMKGSRILQTAKDAGIIRTLGTVGDRGNTMMTGLDQGTKHPETKVRLEVNQMKVIMLMVMKDREVEILNNIHTTMQLMITKRK
jgi:hypothetical protein